MTSGMEWSTIAYDKNSDMYSHDKVVTGSAESNKTLVYIRYIGLPKNSRSFTNLVQEVLYSDY